MISQEMQAFFRYKMYRYCFGELLELNKELDKCMLWYNGQIMHIFYSEVGKNALLFGDFREKIAIGCSNLCRCMPGRLSGNWYGENSDRSSGGEGFANIQCGTGREGLCLNLRCRVGERYNAEKIRRESENILIIARKAAVVPES